MEKYVYDVIKYNFKDIIQSIFSEKLEELHKDYEVFDAHTDQSSEFHKIYYKNINNTNFYSTYKTFIKNVISPKFDEEILYQTIPTFRVHMNGNLSVGEFHKDSTYSHSTDEVNIYLPVTKAFATNTIWVDMSGGYIPMECDFGEFYIWDGANLMHGNYPNKTGQTRVSIDFRILPKSKYSEGNIKSSITNNTKMIIGEYWSKLDE